VKMLAYSCSRKINLFLSLAVIRGPIFKPVKQKTRQMCLVMLLKVKVEIQKQGDARLLEVLHYPQWVVDVLVVPKKNGKIRVCMDYR